MFQTPILGYQHTSTHSSILDTLLTSFNQTVLTTTKEIQQKGHNTRGLMKSTTNYGYIS
jgi:hypothetical protein